jgi:hypothetical protein
MAGDFFLEMSLGVMPDGLVRRLDFGEEFDDVESKDDRPEAGVAAGWRWARLEMGEMAKGTVWGGGRSGSGEMGNNISS